MIIAKQKFPPVFETIGEFVGEKFAGEKGERIGREIGKAADTIVEIMQEFDQKTVNGKRKTKRKRGKLQ